MFEAEIHHLAFYIYLSSDHLTSVKSISSLNSPTFFFFPLFGRQLLITCIIPWANFRPYGDRIASCIFYLPSLLFSLYMWDWFAFVNECYGVYCLRWEEGSCNSKTFKHRLWSLTETFKFTHSKTTFTTTSTCSEVEFSAKNQLSTHNKFSLCQSWTECFAVWWTEQADTLSSEC